MKKVIRDGKVAVIYSPGYGSGWFSWHRLEELLFDPVIVELIETRDSFVDSDDREEINQQIFEYCDEKFGEQYWGGVDELAIHWIPENEEFIIHEYDGCEDIWYKNKIPWTRA